MIRKLRAVDPDLARIFLDQIEVLQEFVDNSIQTAQEKEREWAKAEEEALCQAQEHMRFVAQLEEQRKVDEENAMKWRQPEGRRRRSSRRPGNWQRKRIPIFSRCSPRYVPRPPIPSTTISHRDKRGTTYPAVTGGKCTRCAERSLVCVGISGNACKACAIVHAACSNTGT